MMNFCAEPVKLNDGVQGLGSGWPGKNPQEQVCCTALYGQYDILDIHTVSHIIRPSQTLQTLLAHQPKCHDEACLIVFTVSSLQQIQRPHSFCVEGFEEGHISDRSSEFLYIIAPCGYHPPNREFLMTAVTAHSNDLMPPRLNQCFCEMTIKGVC